MIRTVLHVLPHPGGGGETYVDTLAQMEGYRGERRYLADGSGGGSVAARLAVVRSGIAAARLSRRHNLLHVHGEISAAICAPALAARRSVVTLHGLHVLRRTGGVAHAAAWANLQLIVRAATKTICVSQAEYEVVLGAIGATAEDRVRLVRNGVAAAPMPTAEERAAARAGLGLTSSTVVGVYAGGLDEHKDPDIPVRATLELVHGGAPLALLVAGDGPMRPELERLAAGPGGGAMRLLGHRSDLRRVLAAGDFFVLPSRREGLSFALLEAMSLGLVPVVSDAPGNPEAVGDTGFVARRGEVEGFATAFRSLLGDTGERLDLGRRARERVLQHFRVDKMVEGTRKVYDDVLGVTAGG